MSRSASLLLRNNEEVTMRAILLLVAGSILASCANAPPPPYMERSASGQRAYETLLAGKVPQPPITCLQNYNANEQTIIDGRTLAYRVGSRTTYIMHLSIGCEPLASGTYALLSRQIGGPGMCRGDIEQVVDTMNRVTVGSCTITDIVPYTKP
jgi:hypothetical protein